MEFFFIFLCILLILGMVGNSNPYSKDKREDKLPPEFFDNYYNRDKD